MTNSVSLTGLRADIPLGFMAALGLWRILESSDEFSGIKMRWEEHRGTFIPVLVQGGLTEAELLTACLAHLEAWPEQALFEFRPSVKTTNNGDLRRWRDQFPAFDEWFAAFSVEGHGAADETKVSPLDMSFAAQMFPAGVVKVRTDLQKGHGKRGSSLTDRFREALIGPWLYRDNCHSRGWDASTLKEGAFTFKEPSPMPNSGVAAAVWLAVHSLPCFPCYVDHGRLRARGFATNKGTRLFKWPIWEPAISRQAALTMLGQTARYTRGDTSAAIGIRARGVSAIYSSERRNLTKYTFSLLAPERIL